MAHKLTSWVRRGTSFLTPSGSSANLNGGEAFSTAAEGRLFTKVDPAVDGEDCDHDCSSCSTKYPAKFSIEEDDELYGHVKGWSTHVLVATGKTDWVRDVADEKGSVMEAVDKSPKPANGAVLTYLTRCSQDLCVNMFTKRGLQFDESSWADRIFTANRNQKLMLSASNIPVPDYADAKEFAKGDEPTSILLLPAFTIIDHVTPATTEDLIRHVISSAPTNTTSLSLSHTPDTGKTSESGGNTVNSEDGDTDLHPTSIPANLPFQTRPCPHDALILMCSQKTRDARCGQSAPLLRKEFERILRPLGLYRDMHDERPGGVGIYFISHVGGHKYSANVMVYRREGMGRKGVVEGGNAVMTGEKTDRIGGNDADRQGGSRGEAAQCVWLARVRPEDCEGIVKFTVLQGKVVKPERQLRGGFDREKGLTSW